ncbi:MAG TPA: amino acid adenylation domain-containing protein, partial [Longimicrobiaceae bacterium]|nr:amino acid adenylation domain-containing protein [Longimicrobiaceae bacterium]
MDPGMPEERARYLLDDAGARLVLTRSGGAATVPAGEWEVLCLDDAAAEIAARDGADPERRAVPDNLAYVSYTSGSTGRPKGVMVPHRGVANYLSWCQDAYPLAEGEGSLLHGSVAVDMSVTTLFAPLLAGRAVVLLDAAAGVEELVATLHSGRRFSFVKLTPTHLQVVPPPEGPGGAASATAALIVGGEALFAESLAPWRDGDSGVRIVNEYGPTETVVGCCAHEVSAADAGTGPVPIGRPIANMRVYVLDASLRPVPLGVAGEVYVGGAQVTRGYLGRPGLTAERFLPDPYSPVPGARVYRTGDLARHRQDGALEYLGRTDQQVKIRGYRVELGEIETALLEHPSVREAAVLAREDSPGERRLVAYLAADGELGTREVHDWLRPRLPEHMFPAAVVRLDSLPLTASGKVDRRALPAPVAERPRSGPEFVASRTVVEETLASIWAKVLEIDSVGIHDNFFAVGGDSMRSLMVAGLARERGLPLSIRQIARTPTIAELAAQIQAGQTMPEAEVHVAPFSMISAEDRARLPEGVVDAYPLARMQLGMLYHRDRTPNAPLFHSINSHHLSMGWDRAKFEAAVLHIAERHANLRTSFDLASYSEPLQLVHGEAVFPVGFFDIRHLSEREQNEVLQAFWRAEKDRPFDLSRAPQLRFHIHQRSDDSVQFTLTENHAVVDGWSLHIIYEEMLTCYFALLRGEGFPELPELKTSFRDFIYLERKAMESPEAEEFWRRKLDGYSVTRLPRLPGHRPDYTKPRGMRIDKIVPPRLHARLRRLAREEAVPLKSVLLASHFRVKSFLAGEDDVVTALSGHGRLETSDAERVCGLFLNTYPVRMELGGGSWRELVHRCYEAEIELLPVLRYPMAEVQSKWGAETLCDTSFVYLNFHAIGAHARSGEVKYVQTGAMVEETNFAMEAAFMHLPGYTSQVGLSLTGDRWIFTDQQIRRMVGYYFRALEAIVSGPDAPYDAFSPFADEERRELEAWSVGSGAAGAGEPVHRQFERVAALSPDAACLYLDGEPLSFGEVDRWANRIAHQLRGMGVAAEGRVAVAMDRAPELVPAVLGVLKAGAAYVP